MNPLRVWATLSLVAGLVAFGAIGCSEPPDDAIMKAEDAIKKAVEAGAEEASPRLLGKARTALSEARALADQGHNSDARKKAELAVIQAEQAERNAIRTGGKRMTRPGGGGGDE
ncbi:MAG: DUF4398 domain-containing protein [Calditrichaeota bacterium]|nr:DUF4398 domain-containing protein [Calditrichota bacterium]